MRYVLHSMRMLLRSATQYRASFVMQTLSQVIMTGGDLMAVLVLMDRFTALGQWTADEILFFFGVMQVPFALCEFLNRGLGTFSGMIVRGGFDTLLLRPKSLLLQVICSQLDPRRIGSVVIGAAALAVSSAHMSLRWTWGSALLLLSAVLGTLLMLTGLFILEAVINIFSVRAVEAVNILTYGGRAACQYPVDIYPKPLRVLFTYIAPIALCLHLPVSVILGKPLMNVPAWVACLGPLVGVAFFLMMTQVWRLGVRHYRSTGT